MRRARRAGPAAQVAVLLERRGHPVLAGEPVVLDLPLELDPGREALVEPQRAPVRRGRRVAEPLVRQLMQDHLLQVRRPVGGALRDQAAERDHLLGLHRRGRRHAHHPGALEGVPAEAALQPAEHLRDLAQRLDDLVVGTRPGPDRHRYAVRAGLVDPRVVPDRERGQVAGLRVAAVPGERVAGRPVRLRFAMSDADLFSLRFN